MDYEIFRDAPLRKKEVLEADAFLKKSGIEYIYLQFVSITGRLQGKGIPTKHFMNICEKGFSMVYGATVNVSLDRFGNHLGYPPNASELIAFPDPATLVQLPWDRRIGRVFCTLFKNPNDVLLPGSRLTADCRGNLSSAHCEFIKKHNLNMRIGMEPEMMWLKKSQGVHQYHGASDPLCYHIGQFEKLRPVYMKVLEYAELMGLDMIQGDHEDAPGQLELNFSFDEPLRSCDRLLTYRQICTQVAKEFDLTACFLPKPFTGISGSGCHFNISLWEGGEDAFREQAFKRICGMESIYSYRENGINKFLSAENQTMLTAIGSHTVAGIQKNLDALTAIAAPTVNSYKRLWEKGFWAPILANWGFQNRTCAIRVPSWERIEYRTPDALVNPYLMSSALLKAIDDGLSNQYILDEPIDSNSYATDAERKFIPHNLSDALRKLQKNDVILSSLPGEMENLFISIKTNEWDDFLSQITNWDFETYLNHTP